MSDDGGEGAPTTVTGMDASVGAGADERSTAPTRRPLARLIAIALGALLILGAVISYALTYHAPWKRSGPPITAAGWAPYWQTDSALASFSANVAMFSDVSMFAYSTTAADSVTPYAGLDPNAPLLFKRDARAQGVQVVASIIDATKPREMAAILADPSTRATHVRTIVQFAVDGGYDGVDLDYENFAFNDGRGTWPVTRPNWVAFLTELAAALHAQSKSLAVSVPPVYDARQTDLSGYWVYDYAAMGQVVDHIRIMAYDFSTAEAGPIAPLDWVKTLVKAAKSMVPASKLVLGVPVYGYDWPIATVGICPADKTPRRKNLSGKSAAVLATAKGVVPIWDPVRAERTFSYVEQLSGNDPAGKPVVCTVNRTVWYADSQAVYERAWLAERQDLSGISLWSLGSEDELSWTAIASARVHVRGWTPESVMTQQSQSTSTPVTRTSLSP